MQCSFRRNITLPGAKNRFDLNTSYYIFLADGAADDGTYIDEYSLFKVFPLSSSLFHLSWRDCYNCSLLKDMHLWVKNYQNPFPFLPDSLTLDDLILSPGELDKSSVNCVVR